MHRRGFVYIYGHMKSDYDFVLGFLGVMGYNGIMIIYFKDSRWSKDIVLLPLLDVFTEKKKGFKAKRKRVKRSTWTISCLHPPKSLNPHILILNPLLASQLIQPVLIALIFNSANEPRSRPEVSRHQLRSQRFQRRARSGGPGSCRGCKAAQRTSPLHLRSFRSS
jgi:hypothetical protein